MGKNPYNTHTHTHTTTTTTTTTTTQIDAPGITTIRPWPTNPYSGTTAERQEIAPAKPQDCNSSPVSKRALPRFGEAPSNTHLFRWFHSVHAPKMIGELRPFCSCSPAPEASRSHQSSKWRSLNCGARLVASQLDDQGPTSVLFARSNSLLFMIYLFLSGLI